MADVSAKCSSVVAPPGEARPDEVLHGRRMAPVIDKGGKIWARATAFIQGRPAELYALWRDLESGSKWQEMIADAKIAGLRTSHWVMCTGEKTVEWDAEILHDEPGRRIAWRSVAGDSNHEGEVVFDPAPGGRGTIVTVLVEFHQGSLTTAAQTIFSRDPKRAVVENLRHFKAYAEAGGFKAENVIPTVLAA